MVGDLGAWQLLESRNFDPDQVHYSHFSEKLVPSPQSMTQVCVDFFCGLKELSFCRSPFSAKPRAIFESLRGRVRDLGCEKLKPLPAPLFRYLAMHLDSFQSERFITWWNRHLDRSFSLEGACSVDWNIRMQTGNVLLFDVVCSVHERLALFLIRSGASIDLQGTDWANPLSREVVVTNRLFRHFVCESKFEMARASMVKSDSLLMRWLAREDTALHRSLRYGLTEVALELIMSGADLSVKDWSHQTPKALAVGVKHRLRTQLQLEYQAAIDAIERIESFRLRKKGAVRS